MIDFVSAVSFDSWTLTRNRETVRPGAPNPTTPDNAGGSNPKAKVFRKKSRPAKQPSVESAVGPPALPEQPSTEAASGEN